MVRVHPLVARSPASRTPEEGSLRPQRRVAARTSLLIGACAVVFASAAAGQDAAPELADEGAEGALAEQVAVVSPEGEAAEVEVSNQ